MINSQCPVYYCDTNATATSCAVSTKNSTGFNITLNDKICNTTKPCPFIWADYVKAFSPSGINEVCTVPVAPANWTAFAFAGEACNNASDCANGNCTTSKVCNGMAANTTNCTTNFDCIVGTWCDTAVTNKCVNLYADGANCTQDFQCQVSSFCNVTNTAANSGVCVAEFSIAVGGYSYSQTGCTNALEPGLTLVNGTCPAVTDYATGLNPNSDKMVLCNNTNPCSYNNNLKSLCICGMNDLGQGYCPVPYQYSSDASSKIITQYKAMRSTACHTLHRKGNCTISGVSARTADATLTGILEKTWDGAAAWYKAVPCALTGEFINYSIIALVALLAILF